MSIIQTEYLEILGVAQVSWKYHQGVNYLTFAVAVIPASVTILNGDATSADMSHTEWRYEKPEEERMCST